MKQITDKQTLINAGFQSGLSLIELMISITIGLLILASLSTLFINQSRTRVELDKSNRMIDNGRYALELLSTNLRMAGFYDNYAPIGTPTIVYDPCDTVNLTDPTKNLNILLQHVQGYNAATSSSQIAGPPCASGYNTAGSGTYCSPTYTTVNNCTLNAGSDILVVRRASTAISASATSGVTYLQVSMCATDAATPPNNYQIVTAPAVAPVSFTSMHKKDCAAAADLRQFMVLTYFVSPNNAVTNGVGDGIPTLKQIDQYGNVTPLVEGIEYMQVDYGVDGDNNSDGIMDDINGDGVVDTGDLDGAADSYSATCNACASPANWAKYWSNVVSVRISIVARNQDKTTGWIDTKTYSLGLAGTVGPSNDNYKRHAYTQLVRLVNPAGRKELP